MRNALALIVAVVFVLYSSLLAAAPARACCHEADCPVTQCVAAACTPSAMPALAASLDVLALPRPHAAAISYTPAALPEPTREVWCPPD
jgi:hypothetical protein